MRFVQSCGEVAEAIRSNSSTTVATDRCCGTTMTPALNDDLVEIGVRLEADHG
jgi:hypothetical protein